MVFQLRNVCALREFLFGLMSGLSVPGKKRGGGKVWHLALGEHHFIFFIGDLTVPKVKEGLIQKNRGRQPYSNQDFLPSVHF